MAKRVRTLYEWEGPAGGSTLRRAGTISEASLRAWEYQRADESGKWMYASDTYHDTVRVWVTSRPDLRIPEKLLVGDREEKVEVTP